MIENIHAHWWGNYELLEIHHGYIQWLFPIREDGLNSMAEQLQLHEATAIASDPVLQRRLIRSYEMMLDFYGMKLVDQQTGMSLMQHFPLSSQFCFFIFQKLTFFSFFFLFSSTVLQEKSSEVTTGKRDMLT